MSQHDTPEAVRLADNGGWLDAQSRVPDVLPSVGLSLPVLAIAETDDACFQQTMAIYYSKGRSGMKFPHWRAQRFDDGRDGPVIKVRCWMPRPTFPKNIPGNWNDQPARSAIQAEFAQLEAERDGLQAELEKVRWQPIETAPQDMTECVVVRWVDGDGQEHQDFDYTEDGCWMGWHEHAEHVEMIGGHGVSYTPPYQHYMPLPAAPTPPNADQKGQ